MSPVGLGAVRVEIGGRRSAWCGRCSADRGVPAPRGASDEQIAAALVATGTSGPVALLPEGLGTEVGARGRAPATAQAQEIAIVRVMFSDPDLAIVDEATAEAGSTHSEQLDRAAEAALRGRTGPVIVHRLWRARSATGSPSWSEAGSSRTGPHDELVAFGGPPCTAVGARGRNRQDAGSLSALAPRAEDTELP